MNRFAVLGTLAIVVLLSGCDDDSAGPDDQPFAVMINVTDAQGLPVADLRVASMPVVPGTIWSPPDGGTHRPSTPGWRFTLPAAATVRVEVRNVAGDLVRLLVDRELQAGLHEIRWDGFDDSGDPVLGGWYSFHFESGAQREDTPFWLTVCDPEWCSLGSTGASGRLVLTDRTIVPAFWSPPPAFDIEVTSATLLRLEDDTGAGMYVTFDAVDGPQNVDVTWEPVPEPFSIDLLITYDAQGLEPVANARLGGMPAVPGWAWPGASLGRSAVVVPFDLGEPSAVRVVIEDVTGDTIRTLVEGLQPAGRHHAIWDGLDDSGLSTPGGWYKVGFVAVVDDVVVATGSAGIVKGSFEPDQYVWGETDADGRVQLTDRRLVPGFWDLPPVLVTNEVDEVVGTFDLTTRTWLYVEGAGWVVLDNLVDGRQDITAAVQDSPLDKLVAPGRGNKDGPDPGPTRLLPPYPNPFG